MNMDYDMMQNGGHNGVSGLGEGNWNAEVDMDQWLQFPPEGVSNSDDSFMAGMFNDDSAAQLAPEQVLPWATAFSTEGASVDQTTVGPVDVAVQI
jgi:hypothetical protein